MNKINNIPSSKSQPDESIRLFDRYSPDYFSKKSKYEYYQSAYSNDNFITSENLPKFGKEASDSYTNRLSRAIHYPFEKKTIDKIIKFIESKLHELVKTDNGVESFSNDITLKKQSIESFGLDVLKRALITGQADILFTAPMVDANEIEMLNLAQQEMMNIREYAILLDSGQLVDYELDEFGNYIFAIVESQYREIKAISVKRKEPIRQRTIFYRHGFEIFRLINGQEIRITDIMPYSNNVQRVPIFHLNLGESIIKDIVELSKRWMQVDSLTEDEFYQCLFDIMLFSTNSREVQEATNNGNNVIDLSNRSVFSFESPDTKPDVIRSEVKNAVTKMQYKKELEQKISDLTGLDFVSETEKNRIVSGESKKMDFIITNANLASFCSKLSSFCTELLRFAGRFLNLSDKTIDSINVRYPTDFNIRTILDQLEEISRYIESGANNEIIKAVWTNYIRKNNDVLGISEQEEKKLIESLENEAFNSNYI